MTTSFVVDASVARAAGTARADANEPAPQCVRALEAIRQSGHSVAMGRTLKGEWDKHARAFAIGWLRNMLATRRFQKVDDEHPELVRVLESAAALVGRQPVEVAKDIHLLGTALNSHGNVVSCDVRQRDLLARLNDVAHVLNSVSWASPVEADCEDWIRSGATDRACFGLMKWK